MNGDFLVKVFLSAQVVLPLSLTHFRDFAIRGVYQRLQQNVREPI